MERPANELQPAIYARVSDDKKKEDGDRRQDVNRQLELLRDHMKRLGFTEWREYIDDGKSGWTDDLNSRPAFKKLRTDVFRRLVSKVYVEAMDRFSSNMIAGMGWLEEFSKIGNCSVVSLAEGEYEVTSDDGWAKSAMFLFMAEWRIRNLRSKIRSGMKRRLEDGRATCKACNEVHIGRHPLKCNCLKCLKKRGGRKSSPELPMEPAQAAG